MPRYVFPAAERGTLQERIQRKNQNTPGYEAWRKRENMAQLDEQGAKLYDEISEYVEQAESEAELAVGDLHASSPDTAVGHLREALDLCERANRLQERLDNM